MDKKLRFINILKEVRENTSFGDGIFFMGNIPEKKFENAKKTMGVPEGEDVLILFDDTAFGSAKDGMVFTTWGIRYKEFLNDVWSVSWENLYTNGYRETMIKKDYCLLLWNKIEKKYSNQKRIVFAVVKIDISTLKTLIKLGKEVLGNKDSTINSLEQLLAINENSQKNTEDNAIDDSVAIDSSINEGTVVNEDDEENMQKSLQATKLCDKGGKLVIKNKFDDAIQVLNESLSLNANDSTAYAFRGVAYDAVEEYDEAIRDLSDAIRLDPANFTYYKWRGDAYYHKEQYDSALADYNEYIKTNHSDDVCFNLRGNVYYAINDYNSAVQDYKRALKIKPKDKTYLENLQNAEDALEEEQKGSYSKANSSQIQERVFVDNAGKISMKCNKCQSELESDARFCSSCGSAVIIDKFCSNCGHKLDGVANFCDSCGAKIG